MKMWRQIKKVAFILSEPKIVLILHRIWRNALGGNSSVGRAQPCQGWGRGSESRFPLFFIPFSFLYKENSFFSNEFIFKILRQGDIGQHC